MFPADNAYLPADYADSGKLVEIDKHMLSNFLYYPRDPRQYLHNLRESVTIR